MVFLCALYANAIFLCALKDTELHGFSLCTE